MTRILVDENIPAATAVLAPLGNVATFAGRALRAADLQGVEALIVRSVTPVDRALLAGSEVRFVGTATIGTDHLDLSYLESKGIRWCHAPGSNADSVVDYCLSALSALPGVLEALLDGERVGIVGYGNVGSRLHRRLAALGIGCVAYDPFLAPAQCPVLAPLETVLNSRVVSLHTPLTDSGPHPTRHLLGTGALTALPENAVLINAGRGEVLATDALLALVRTRPDIQLVLDVWENEPAIDPELVRACALATPHIAGYSADGKWRGLLQVAGALADFLGQSLPTPSLPAWLADAPRLAVDSDASRAGLIRDTVLAVYDIRRDDRALRGVVVEGEGQGEGQGESESDQPGFDRLRREYPLRRELSACTVSSAEALPTASEETLVALGVSTA